MKIGGLNRRALSIGPLLALCATGGTLGVAFFVGLAFFQLRSVSMGWIGYTDEYLVIAATLGFALVLLSLFFQPDGKPVTRKHLVRNLVTSFGTLLVSLVNVAFIEATFNSTTVAPHVYALLTLTVAGIALPAGSATILAAVALQSIPNQEELERVNDRGLPTEKVTEVPNRQST